MFGVTAVSLLGMTLPNGDATRAEAVGGEAAALPAPTRSADCAANIAEDGARRAVEGRGIADRLTPRRPKSAPADAPPE